MDGDDVPQPVVESKKPLEKSSHGARKGKAAPAKKSAHNDKHKKTKAVQGKQPQAKPQPKADLNSLVEANEALIAKYMEATQLVTALREQIAAISRDLDAAYLEIDNLNTAREEDHAYYQDEFHRNDQMRAEELENVIRNLIEQTNRAITATTFDADERTQAILDMIERRNYV